MKQNIVFGILYLNIVLYAFCYMMQQPVLPDLIKTYVGEGTSTEVEWAKLQTVFAALQMVGVLTSGYISDVMGAKTVLILSQVASILGYGLQWHTDSLMGLYVSRIPGIFQHAFMGTAAYITDVTPAASRSQMLGYIQLAYGVGMVVGPLTGGYFSDVDLSLCSFTATIVSCFALVLILMLPNTKAGIQDKTKPDSSISECLKVLAIPEVRHVTFMKVFAALAMSTWQSTFVVAAENFGFGSKERGYVMVYMSVIGMVFIGVGSIKRLEALFSINELNILTGCLLAAAYIIVPSSAWVTGHVALPYDIKVPLSVVMLVVLLIPIVGGTAVLRSTIPSLFTRSVDSSKSGLVLGVDMSLGSLAGLVSPSFGAAVYSYFGFQGLGLSCSLLVLAMSLTSYLDLGKAKRD